ncbi:ribophorin I family protein [Loa loa]|uniref:Dolichyl-diphosphooligosaccharide--protein glycosyltransferase subunit 1 n=1 Tax=Loa loa TaxID=7209 RepID=A0A1I7V817_LOALO|nr:ribophorin I family protein [Loa loa]EFO27718.1 ribophorin I family protein [Loa loa]
MVMSWWKGFPALLVIASLVGSTELPSSDITISVERVIDISTQIVKVTDKYEVTNEGSKEINSFVHLVHEKEHLRLAYISAIVSKKDTGLKVSLIDHGRDSIKEGFVAYKIELQNAIPPNGKTVVTVEYQLTEYLEPHPKRITQAESQFVVYKGNAHVPSIYPVKQEKTVVLLPSGKLESRTTVPPTSVDNGKIIYGPYIDQKPYAVVEVVVHYENNTPFIVATDVVRVIEVSHWGNIAVEEAINVVHKGAELKGSFSRLDFQMDRRGSKRPVVTQYKTLLPASAKDIYYRDEIGNISTSAVRKMTDVVELIVQPRFPLFGGWKTDYVLGYNVPAYQYLYSSGNKFALKMRIVDHLFDDAVIKNLKLKIILPEGSKDFKLTTPYPMTRHPDELHFTYLDTTGRPVITVEKDNLVDFHIQMFTLHYEFDRMQLWREPFLACAAFATLFVAVIIYVRLDFTIWPDVATESRLQAQGQVEQLTDLHADRLKIYDHFADAVNKFKNNKDLAAFTTARKKAENDLKNVGQAIADLQSELKSTNADISDKLNEVNKMHKLTMDVINNYLGQTERFIKGQLSKVAFADAEKSYAQKLNEAKQRMDSVIYAL